MANPPKSTKNSSSDGKKADFRNSFFICTYVVEIHLHIKAKSVILEIIIPKYSGSVDWKL